MMCWWFGVLVPGARVRVRSAAAFLTCFAVEFSQLLHGPGLDALRATTPGRLVLGSGFDPRDLIAYGLGVLAAAALEAGGSRILSKKGSS